MATKSRDFNLDFYYHVYNRGVEKREIFETEREDLRFLAAMRFYLTNQPLPYPVLQEMSPQTQAKYLNPSGWSERRQMSPAGS